MRFVSKSDVRSRFEGKRVTVVGSGPGVLRNEPGFIDGHQIVVRVNNYKLSTPTGFRCDAHYSFYGTSIRKTADELKRDGVTLCMVKTPPAHAIESEWHRVNDKMIGVDYRPHYERRKDWWFCDVMVPTVAEFLELFNLLGQHQPTTGFAAIHDVLSFQPASLYLTGFDFFSSGLHNVNERWRVKNLDDPIRHRPDLEREWLKANIKNYPITVDPLLARTLNEKVAA